MAGVLLFLTGAIANFVQACRTDDVVSSAWLRGISYILLTAALGAFLFAFPVAAILLGIFLGLIILTGEMLGPICRLRINRATVFANGSKTIIINYQFPYLLIATT